VQSVEADGLTDLFEGLEGEARQARVTLLESLRGRGCSADEIQRAHEKGRLELLPLELNFREEGSRTLEETAAAHGVDPDALESTRRALGLPTERGAPIYGAALDDHAQRLAVALEAGMPLEALEATNRVIGRSMAAVAAAARDALAALLAQSGVSEDERPLRAAEAVRALAPELERVLSYAFLEQVRDLVRRESGESLLASGEAADVRAVGIAFADLVGFTSMSQGLGPAELGGVAGRLEDLALEALRPGVSLVKTIGDEVMLASEDVPALVETVLDLVAAAAAPSEGLPPLRAGAAAGRALQRAGDWYGQTVNLASRLTALAEPGSLLVDEGVRQAAAETAPWSAHGACAVRGLDQPVSVHSARAVPT
jgi:adenylate cyclase